jgi:DNA repair protein RecO (recombination protein O)
VSLPDQVTRAFLLRSVDYGESDRVLTLLTEHRGRIAAIARGARRSQKRFGGALEPFALLEVALARGRGELWRLTEATLVEAHPGLSRDLARIGAAAFVLELVRELAPEDQPEPGLFRSIEEVLGLLASAEGTAVAALAFGAALRVLALAGIAVSVTACTACGKPVPAGRKVLFDPRRGGVVCSACGGGPIALSAVALALLVQLERTLLADLARVAPPDPIVDEVDRTLTAFLEQRLERPLRSAAFRSKFGAGSTR